MRFLRRALVVTAVSAALLVTTSFVAGAASTLNVQTGSATPDQAVQLVAFSPGTITVDVGDAVTWSLGADEPHTVSFGTPPFPPGDDKMFAPAGGSSYDGSGFLNSGLMLPGPASKPYTLTFTKAGTFNYQCLLHPSMKGTVVVQAAGSPYPAQQATYKAASDPVVVAALKAGQAALSALKVTNKSTGNGTTTHTMDAGLGDGKTYAILRFGASKLTIHAGDSVTWTQNDPNEIHTVTFLDNGKDVAFVLPSGTTNPQAAAPAGGKVYSGTGYFNSGILVPVGSPPQAGPSSYTLTFAKPGTYEYICLLHDEIGMKGTIDVLAAMPTALPKTGGFSAAIVPVLGLIGLALILGGIGVQRRHNI